MLCCYGDTGVCAHVQANQKLMEEQRRAERYLETSKESQSVKLVTPPLPPPSH